MTKIGIVGSQGFIGKSIIQHFRAREIDIVEFNSQNKVVEQGKISQRANGLTKIIWAASRVNPSSANIHPELVELEFREWIEYLTLLELEARGTEIFFLSSGGCTYSGKKPPFKELDEAEGTNQYGKLKARMEKELIISKLRYTIFRISNVYGPGQPHGRGQGVIAEWISALSEGRAVKIIGSSKSYRDYIYIDDLCEGIFRSVEVGAQQEIWNLGSGKPTSLQEVVSLIEKITQLQLDIEYENARTIDRGGYFLDISRIMQRINWEPNTSMESGLKLTLPQNITNRG